ncbi:hypothetical protein GGS20DRAFT_542358 [Poronia punctata]|nr:hypothetical protein GGS20DRAFT_542358 [Poronia punctata]
MTCRLIPSLKQAVANTQYLQISSSSVPKRYISQQILKVTAPRTPICATPRIYWLGAKSHLRQTINAPSTLRNLSHSAVKNMASDEDYMAFLDKANKDPNEGYVKPRSNEHEFKTTDEGAAIPAAIREATRDAFYVSDADEPFVPVCLAWDEAGKGLPDEEEFAALIHHPDPSKAEIEIQDPADWDTQGQYREIVDAITKAGKGNDVRVYRIAKSGVKVEYWIVTMDGKGAGAKLIGAKALAVES